MALMLSLAACATAGVKVDEAKLTRFHKGETTYAQVLAALGPPTSETLFTDGRRTAGYTFTQYSMRPETFIPYVGFLVGGADVRASSVIIEFSPDGTVSGYGRSASQIGAATGLASGSAAARTDQPRTGP